MAPSLTTPRDEGFAMPREWAPHTGCVMAWPCRRSMWGDQLDAAKAEHAATARAVARFEPVTLVAAPDDVGEAASACGSGVEVVGWPIDDSWTRDMGAIVVTRPDGERRAVDFAFNAWGEKFQPHDQDARFAERMADHLGLGRYDASPFVLEGGSVTVDGAGTLVTTEQCLLHPNRNPSLRRADIEAALRTWLGVQRVVWLPHGLVEDDDTDGHVDNVAAFVAPGVVLAQATNDPRNPNASRLRENLRVLRAAGLTVRSLDVLPYADVGGERVVVPPTNLYQANGGVIVPIVDGPDGTRALAAVRAALPGRTVVGVPSTTLAFGGGGVHCITQQVPA
jgi:agmatine deiminase